MEVYIKRLIEMEDDIVEKLEVCLCIKDVFHLNWSNYEFAGFSKNEFESNPDLANKTIYTNEKAFEKGKYYKYFIEDEYSFWVYYNEDGEQGETGYRFVSDKVKDASLTRSFKEHFIYGRFLKLKELEKINYE